VLAVGRARLSFQWNLTMVAIIPLILWQGSTHFGLTGLAGAWIAIGLIGYVPNWYFLVRSTCGARFVEYTVQIAVPVGLAAAAGAVAWLATAAVGSPLSRLLVGGLVGAVVYLAGSLVFNRSWVAAMRQLLAGGVPRALDEASPLR
jgi:hypothetical protein